MTDSQPASHPDIHVAVAKTRYAYRCIAPKNGQALVAICTLVVPVLFLFL